MRKYYFRRAYCKLAPRSAAQLVGDFPSVRGELLHHLAVQPDIHFRAAVLGTGVAELGRELLAVGETGVEVEHFHQIDDRLLVIQALAFLRGGVGEGCVDIHHCRICGCCLNLRAGLSWTRCRLDGARRCFGLAENGVFDRSENAHGDSVSNEVRYCINLSRYGANSVPTAVSALALS